MSLDVAVASSYRLWKEAQPKSPAMCNFLMSDPPKFSDILKSLQPKEMS